jgi:hypothetical protein
MLNYETIVDNLDEEYVKKLLEKLDIPYEDKGSYLIMPTYCHHHKDEQASNKLYYYKDNKFFMCYSHCQGMSIFSFLKNFYDSQNIAYDWYRDVYCVLANLTNVSSLSSFATPAYKSKKDKYARRNKDIQLPIYPKSILSIFSDDLPTEWLLEGITEESMVKYDIKYSISQNKIIIPHYNISGELIGIRGRALNKEEAEEFGKYMPVKLENKWYSHPLGLNLYGLNIAREAINKTKRVIIMEGEKSVLKYDGFYRDNNCIAVCGSNLHKTQLDLLLKYTKAAEIVIAFDKEYEVPASPQGEEYFNKLYSLCNKYKQYYNFSFIYDKEGLLSLKDSPVDRGKEVFEELLKKRVIIT